MVFFCRLAKIVDFPSNSENFLASLGRDGEISFKVCASYHNSVFLAVRKLNTHSKKGSPKMLSDGNKQWNPFCSCFSPSLIFFSLSCMCISALLRFSLSYHFITGHQGLGFYGLLVSLTASPVEPVSLAQPMSGETQLGKTRETLRRVKGVRWQAF